MDKTEIIKSIEDLINNGLNEEAFFLIKEYKKNIGIDEDILSTEAVLNIYIENYDIAMIVIREGLKYNVNSSDLYYTMGNVFEIKGDFNRAYLCYEQALFLCSSLDNKEMINENIINLKRGFKVKVNSSSIVMLTFNQLEYTKVCLNSIKSHINNSSCEIIIVDNNSTDGTVEWLKEQKDIKVIFNKENKGFPAGCNQGINMAKKENDILLLNNDTVLMPNSIFNLRMALYSDEIIGATGAVSNSVAYHQKVEIFYDDFDEYIAYATKNNISNEEKYEERNKLVGFAILIKREILEKVGYLDERFTPGNYEDDDLSLRIVQEGYKLLLCWDSYIHHFGSVSFRENKREYLKLLEKNKKKCIQKWGFNTDEALSIYEHCYEFIKNEDENVLEISCGTGSNLLALRMKNSNNRLYGYEENKNLIKIIKNNKIEQIQDLKNEKYKGFFNQVIIKDYMWIQEDCKRVKEVFDIIDNKNGNMLVIFDVLKDCVYELKEEIVIKTKEFCEKSGFELVNAKYLHYNEKNVQCYLYFRKKDRNLYIEDDIYNVKLKFLFRRIEFDILYDEVELELLKRNEFTDEIIIGFVNKNTIKKVKVLNYIAIFFFNNSDYEHVIPYLEEAYRIDKNDNDTLYNLSYVLKFIGQKDLALNYAEKIIDKTPEVLELIESIRGV